jgi:hypothetical protein
MMRHLRRRILPPLAGGVSRSMASSAADFAEHYDYIVVGAGSAGEFHSAMS